jgi:hypothetical protein
MTAQNELSIASTGKNPDTKYIIYYLSRLNGGYNNDTPKRQIQDRLVHARIEDRQKETDAAESNCKEEPSNNRCVQHPASLLPGVALGVGAKGLSHSGYGSRS